MSKGKTLTGVDFEYTGSRDSGLVVLLEKSALKITPEIVG
jgi:hypothetical protein